MNVKSKTKPISSDLETALFKDLAIAIVQAACDDYVSMQFVMNNPKIPEEKRKEARANYEDAKEFIKTNWYDCVLPEGCHLDSETVFAKLDERVAKNNHERLYDPNSIGY